MSENKNINLKLDPNNTREGKIISFLSRLKKEQGISHKDCILDALETKIEALEGSQTDIVLKEIRELKQILLLASNSNSLSKVKEPERQQKDKLKEISATDETITKADIDGF